MIFIIPYVGVLIALAVVTFRNNTWALRYEHMLVRVHIVLFVILLIDLFLMGIANTSFVTFWFDRLLAVLYLLSGAAIFAFYRKKLPLITKIYFGFFLFYPVAAALSYVVDGIFFALVSAPLLTVLLSPDIYYTDWHYSLRSGGGMLSSRQMILVRKGLFTETAIGRCRGEFVEGTFTDLDGVTQNSDSIVVTIKIDGKKTDLVFSQRPF